MVKKKDIKKENDLCERTFNFAVNIVIFLKNINYSKVNDVIKYQLAKAATSIGANYEEAQGAYSKGDFRFKVGICLREARESNYWLRIIKKAGLIDSKELDIFIQESGELKGIFMAMNRKVNYRESSS